MGYLSSSVQSRARGGYGVQSARGGLPLLALGGSLLGGAIRRTASGLIRRLGGKTAVAVGTGVSIGSAIPGRSAPPGMIPKRGIRGKVQRLLPGGESGFVRRRRMNVANPKALRRAIRRTDGFVKLARRTLKGTGFTIARRGLSKAARPSRKR